MVHRPTFKVVLHSISLTDCPIRYVKPHFYIGSRYHAACKRAANRSGSCSFADTLRWTIDMAPNETLMDTMLTLRLTRRPPTRLFGSQDVASATCSLYALAYADTHHIPLDDHNTPMGTLSFQVSVEEVAQSGLLLKSVQCPRPPMAACYWRLTAICNGRVAHRLTERTGAFKDRLLLVGSAREIAGYKIILEYVHPTSRSAALHFEMYLAPRAYHGVQQSRIDGVDDRGRPVQAVITWTLNSYPTLLARHGPEIEDAATPTLPVKARPAVVTETFVSGPIGLNYHPHTRRVESVAPNSALSRRGTVQSGDTVMEVNGEGVRDMTALQLAKYMRQRPITIAFQTRRAVPSAAKSFRRSNSTPL